MPRHSQNRETRRTRLDEFGTDSADTQESTILRAAAHGRFLSEPPEPAPNAPGWRKPSTGRFVGYEINEHEVERSAATGRIESLGPGEPIDRDEQIDRFGHPDGANSEPTNEPPQRNSIGLRDAVTGALGLSSGGSNGNGTTTTAQPTRQRSPDLFESAVGEFGSGFGAESSQLETFAGDDSERRGGGWG